MRKLKIKKGFVVQRQANKIVIFDGEESLLYTFNSTASFIFEKIRRKMGNQQIVDVLVKQYSISKKRAEKDLKEFISELMEKGIAQKA